MSGKVLGFDSEGMKKGKKYITFRTERLVPVVSVEEHNNEIEKLRKHLDSVIAFRNKKFVSVEERDSQIRKACIDGFAQGDKAGREKLFEWLKKWCKSNGYCYCSILGLEKCEDAVAMGNKPHMPMYISVKDLLLAVEKKVKSRD